MRITDQYFWNFVFLVFFLILVFMGMVVLDSEAYKVYSELTFVDFTLMTLATFRVIRLFTHDKITAFFREQFYDATESRGKVILIKPANGPRRTIADLLSCPWCFGAWASAVVVFLYLLTPYAFFPIMFLAIAGVATFIHLLASVVGWKAEQTKMDVEGG
ncbi:MAG: DUF1360 domain-containing protein [Candidatus Pacebacteria bacterium]|nr:DUF1360 domain-containing protein [Candidatus Paceibacterota bacterium]MCF7856893.1 DUF1360 domain-containing protein [Candidatus Paceibacterota bacterium]